MARKSAKTDVKATETAIESKVEDIKTEDKATEMKVAEETAAGRKKATAKKAASKTEEAKTPKETVKETKEAEVKETAEKPAKAAKAAKDAAKDSKAAEEKTARSAVKKTEVKCSLQVQYAGKAYGQEDLEKRAREIWKGELKQKAGDLKSIELYVKPEENKVYYVMNGEFKGNFDI